MQGRQREPIRQKENLYEKTIFDVVIIGGGIIGCSVALALIESGLHVAIVESQTLGSGASTAAIGGLAPQSDEFIEEPLRQLAMDSVLTYRAWLNHLADLTGIEVEYHTDGQLELAFTEEEVQALEKRLQEWNKEQFDVKFLTPTEIHEMEPLISSKVLAGCHMRGEHHLDPVALFNAVTTALHYKECTILEGHPVVEILRSKGRATGVKLSNGSSISANQVVLAAGAWSGHIQGVPHCPVTPLKGQVVMAKPHSQLFHCHIHAMPGYIVPRTNGHLILGATYENVGYDKRVTTDGVNKIITSTVRLSPAIADCEIVKYWAGLRPKTPDSKPILGISSQLEHLIFATGHLALGITLAPITARAISELVLNGSTSINLDDYSPDRFKVRSQGKSRN